MLINHSIREKRWRGGSIHVYSLCFATEAVTEDPVLGGSTILCALSVAVRLPADEINYFILLFCSVVLLLKLRRLR
jgi:hypothetical protein